MDNNVDQLCESAKQGDLDAASQLVKLHHERIYCYLRRLSGNDEEARDLTQKTFFKVWVSLASYQGRSSFSTWLHGIAHHVYLDWQRKASRLDSQTDEWWVNCVADTPNPLEQAVDKDMAGRLYALVEQLDEQDREAVHLHYYQGLSLRETAEILEIALSTLKYRLRDALNVLRVQMAESKSSAR